MKVKVTFQRREGEDVLAEGFSLPDGVEWPANPLEEDMAEGEARATHTFAGVREAIAWLKDEAARLGKRVVRVGATATITTRDGEQFTEYGYHVVGSDDEREAWITALDMHFPAAGKAQ